MTFPTPTEGFETGILEQAHESAVSAPAAVTSAQVSTANGSDAGTTETLANALKVAYNAAQMDIAALRATLAATVTAHNALVAAAIAAGILASS